MFTVQYNRNTFNPASRANWVHAYTGDTLEAARAYLVATRARFKHVFGYPSDVKYRVVKTKA